VAVDKGGRRRDGDAGAQVRGGELLDRVINKEHYTELEAARCFAQIMSAIQYLHRCVVCALPA
jgi:hypothetical protein